jgi:CHAT domain-containing protein/tetratricopeptide (TPR) repeat protein
MPTTAALTAESFVKRLIVTDDAARRRVLIERCPLPPVARANSVRLLLDEAYRLLNANPLRMEALCCDALLLAEQADDDFLRGLAIMRHAEALRAQGRNAETCARAEQARAIFLRLDHPVEAALTRISWIWATAFLGRTEAALAAARGARRILRAHGEMLALARLETNLGVVYAQAGRYRSALRCFTSALTLHRSRGAAGIIGMARSHQNRGLALTRLGRHREGLFELHVARGLFAQERDPEGAKVIRSIGEHQLQQGHYAAALRSFAEARAAFAEMGVRDGGLWYARDAADCYLLLNRPADALTAIAAAADAVRHSDDIQDQFALATRQIAALLSLGRYAESLAALREAERLLATGAGDRRSWLQAQRAAVLLHDGALADAIAVAREAITLARQAGAPRVVADALITEASAELALGNAVAALPVAARAQRLARRLDAAPLIGRACELLGRIAEARQQPLLAQHQYVAAITAVEREQRGVIFEFRDSFAVTRGVAYERLALLQLQAGEAARALATVERFKSRALVDAITGQVDLRPRGSAAARRIARELAAAREDYAAAQATRLSDAVTPLPLEDIASLARLERRVTQLVAQLQLWAEPDAVVELPLVPPGQGQWSPPGGTALVEFFMAGDALLRFVVDATGVRGEALPVSVSTIERLLHSFRLTVDMAAAATVDERGRVAGQAQRLLQRLYDHLLSGLSVLDSCRHLVIVPHGVLHYLPFHALYDGHRYLVERIIISIAPSAALYRVCLARAERHGPTRALVLGHSSGGQLPHALAEATTVATICRAPVRLEGAATRALLATEGRHVGLIHIAAHGQFRADAPLFSQVVLADGPLTVADVYELELRAALVTLSACETGRAVIGGGDELAGLARAFLYAGAAGLLVSQWRVDDAATAALMERFYRELRRGTGRATALARAQRDLIQATLPQSDWRHPFYWAGLQLIGDDSPVYRGQRQAGRRKVRADEQRPQR